RHALSFFLTGMPTTEISTLSLHDALPISFHLGWMAVASGMYDCVLALGVEKLSDPDKAKSLRAFNSAVDVSELAEIEKRLGRSDEGGRDRSLFMDLYISMLSAGAPSSQEALGGITREQMALVS